MKYLVNECNSTKNYYKVNCYFHNAWISKEGWETLSELKKQARQAKTFKVGEMVKPTSWILKQQNSIFDELAKKYPGARGGWEWKIEKMTEKALYLRGDNVDSVIPFVFFWCPKSQIEIDISKNGNPKVDALVLKYEQTLNKLEQNRKDRDELTHRLNKIPYDIRNIERKQKNISDKIYKIRKDFRESEEGKKYNWRSSSDVQEANKKLELLHPEILSSRKESDELEKQIKLLKEEKKELEKKITDIKQRVDEPLIIELGKIEKQFAEVVK